MLPSRLDAAKFRGLQWGRDQQIAEMSPVIPLMVMFRSFNGAAISRSRKYALVDAASVGGHCFNGAAISRSRKWAGAGAITRAKDPGFNGAAISRSRKYCLHLPGFKYCRPCCFNGAAISRSRKCLPHTRSTLLEVWASMGPRSADRGNGGCPSCRTWRDITASMGPRSADRGNIALHSGHFHRFAASMGPRSADRGNKKNHQHRENQDRASMGPRSADRGNGIIRSGGSTGP